MDIRFIEEKKLFFIDTDEMTYAMGLDPEGFLCHLYWGAGLGSPDDVPEREDVTAFFNSVEGKYPQLYQEYACWGGYFFDEPALKATFHDGARDVLPVYQDPRIEKGDGQMTLTVSLCDKNYPLHIDLVYRIYADLSIVDRNCLIRNDGRMPVTLESAQSASWILPQCRQYRLTHFSGSWGREYQPERTMVAQSRIVLETRRGTSGPDSTPIFFVDENGQATEEQGNVWFGGLHWSGNWKISVTHNRYHQLSVTGGIHTFDFAWILQGGESFTTPVFTGGFTKKGFGDASAIFHGYQKKHLLSPKKAGAVMPVLFNAYGTFRSDINEEKLMGLVDRAREVGVELFFVDAGWHGFSENKDANLGDWEPRLTRFPRGLKPLIDKVNAAGMDFGIWMEPEMVNANSRIFREHPDWIMRFPNREGTYHASRWILNLARDDVREHVYQVIHNLLSENNIKCFKIDNNRYITEMGRPGASPAEQKADWVRYVRNFYEIFARLNRDFPDVMFENCASGGGRVDLEMTRYFSRINRSDNQDPLDILKLHEGFSYAYLPKMAGGGCHIGKEFPAMVNRRRTPMRYQAHAAMMGSLAIGENLLQLNPDEMEELKGYIALHKDIRHTVHLGQIYRLVSPRENPYAAFEYAAPDAKKAVLFLFGQSIQFRDTFPNVRLRALGPDTVYDVEGHRPMTGRGLMEVGLPVRLVGDFDSRVIRISARQTPS